MHAQRRLKLDARLWCTMYYVTFEEEYGMRHYQNCWSAQSEGGGVEQLGGVSGDSPDLQDEEMEEETLMLEEEVLLLDEEILLGEELLSLG